MLHINMGLLSPYTSFSLTLQNVTGVCFVQHLVQNGQNNCHQRTNPISVTFWQLTGTYPYCHYINDAHFTYFTVACEHLNGDSCHPLVHDHLILESFDNFSQVSIKISSAFSCIFLFYLLTYQKTMQ